MYYSGLGFFGEFMLVTILAIPFVKTLIFLTLTLTLKITVSFIKLDQFAQNFIFRTGCKCVSVNLYFLVTIPTGNVKITDPVLLISQSIRFELTYK